MSKLIESTIQSLIESNHIPEEGSFDITDDLVTVYCNEYVRIKGGNDHKKKSDIRFSRRMAGLNLLNLLNSRNVDKTISKSRNSERTKSGFVYCIENPAFEGFCKIGMTLNPESRLSSYQTYDPLKRYRFVRVEFVEDRRRVEKEILNHHSIDMGNGEWVKHSDIVEIFNTILKGA